MYLKEAGGIGEWEEDKPRVLPRIRIARAAEEAVWEEACQDLASNLPYRATRTTAPPAALSSNCERELTRCGLTCGRSNILKVGQETIAVKLVQVGRWGTRHFLTQWFSTF